MTTLKKQIMSKGYSKAEAEALLDHQGIESQSQKIERVGTCPDGNNRADVYELPENEGFFYIDASAGDIIVEGLPEGFENGGLHYKEAAE